MEKISDYCGMEQNHFSTKDFMHKSWVVAVVESYSWQVAVGHLASPSRLASRCWVTFVTSQSYLVMWLTPGTSYLRENTVAACSSLASPKKGAAPIHGCWWKTAGPMWISFGSKCCPRMTCLPAENELISPFAVSALLSAVNHNHMESGSRTWTMARGEIKPMVFPQKAKNK